MICTSFMIFCRLSPYNTVYSSGIQPPKSPLANGCNPFTALPPYKRKIWEGFPLNFHLSHWPIRLLARDLCLIPQSLFRLCSTATDLFPGLGGVSILEKPTQDLLGFFLHWRRLLRQRQNLCFTKSKTDALCLQN